MPAYHRMPAVTQPTWRLSRLWHGLYRKTDKLDRHSRLLWGGCNGPKYLTWVFRFTILWISIYVAVFSKVYGPQLIFARDGFADVNPAVRSAIFVIATIPVPIIFFPLLRDAVALYVMSCNVELMKDPAVVTRVFQYQRGTHAVHVLKTMTRIKKNQSLMQHIKAKSRGFQSGTPMPEVPVLETHERNIPTRMRSAGIRHASEMRSRVAGSLMFGPASRNSSEFSVQETAGLASTESSHTESLPSFATASQILPRVSRPGRATSELPMPTRPTMVTWAESISETKSRRSSESCASPKTWNPMLFSSLTREQQMEGDQVLEEEFQDMFRTYSKMYKRPGYVLSDCCMFILIPHSGPTFILALCEGKKSP